jgi:hypothetical protein
MDIETAATPYPEPVIAPIVPIGAGSGEAGNSASLQATSGGNPDGSGTPVTGGWPPPAK